MSVSNQFLFAIGDSWPHGVSLFYAGTYPPKFSMHHKKIKGVCPCIRKLEGHFFMRGHTLHKKSHLMSMPVT